MKARRSPAGPRRPARRYSIPADGGTRKIEQQGFDFASYGLQLAPSGGAHPVADEVRPGNRKRRTRSSAPLCGPASSDEEEVAREDGANEDEVPSYR